MRTDDPDITFTVQADDDGKRFDKVIRKLLPGISLSAVYRIIRTGAVRLNLGKVRPAVKVVQGDRIDIPSDFTPSLAARSTGNTASPPGSEQIFNFIEKLRVFENSDLLVLNKPRGCLIHGKNSLTSRVCDYWHEAYHKHALSFRPGPVHRLDRNTTGLQMFCLSVTGARVLAGQFKESHIKKVYIALVHGRLRQEQEWTDWLGRDTIAKRSFAAQPFQGRRAVLRIIPVASRQDISCVVCLPQTGRTHQIRLQCGLHGYPLLGDKKYGKKDPFPYYLLHAAGISMEDTFNTLNIPPLFAVLPEQSKALFSRFFSPRVLRQVYDMVHNFIGMRIAGGA